MNFEINPFSYNKGVEAFQNKDYKSAIDFMSKAMDENPQIEFLQAYKVRGFAYSNLGRNIEAIKDLTFAEKHLKNEQDIYSALGTNHKSIKDYDNAIKNYISCLKINYNHDNSHYNLQMIYGMYQQKGDYEKALILLNQIIQLKETPEALAERENLKSKIKSSKNYILFFDTETTGVPRNWKAPASDTKNWPRLVQLAWLLYDENGNIIESQNVIIKPDNFIIPKEASNIHGITTEKAYADGKDLITILNEFESKIKEANLLIAHNISFDEKIMGAEFFRRNNSNPLTKVKKFCTMEKSTNICKIDGHYGFKWPKLQELHYFLFKENFIDAHDAKADIQATAKCYFELKRRNLI
ncbi:exonuclease domain-containing protein [Tenacibaculum finnmarkense]|uniref:exonuclease domain-containing protein n=1 Tax=Tenacibaculum finnmarkense TaxID=2781243 RepID=UPI001EFB5CFC|nr:exonuclease domain-containing protein [Tenacibaculum finnmarkense]MCG8796443.1 hypothetical protein [Tenacibaculum finnmarkense]MCG8798773.1 hypothetical protein [Tenacibaculum finnmarkense]